MPIPHPSRTDLDDLYVSNVDRENDLVGIMYLVEAHSDVSAVRLFSTGKIFQQSETLPNMQIQMPYPDSGLARGPNAAGGYQKGGFSIPCTKCRCSELLMHSG